MSGVKLFLQVLHSTLDITNRYLTTASRLKEIIIVKSYCAEYYLLSDTKTTR